MANPRPDNALKPSTLRRLESLEVGANYLAITTKTLRRWIAAGRVAGYRTGPRMIRVDMNELDAMLRPIPSADDHDAA